MFDQHTPAQYRVTWHLGSLPSNLLRGSVLQRRFVFPELQYYRSRIGAFTTVYLPLRHPRNPQVLFGTPPIWYRRRRYHGKPQSPMARSLFHYHHARCGPRRYRLSPARPAQSPI